MPRALTYGGARAMWVLALFDLPVKTRADRKRYVRFRNYLLDDGFLMLQWSVYARPCPNEENAQIHARRVEAAIPPRGEVRILSLTDMQFSRMRVFCSGGLQQTEKPPEQLTLF
jgi:CRISPR-associated protein Cas2